VLLDLNGVSSVLNTSGKHRITTQKIYILDTDHFHFLKGHDEEAMYKKRLQRRT
jgi:hypothetical protein